MRIQPITLLVLLTSWLFVPAGAEDVPAASFSGLLVSTILANLSIAITVVLLGIFGLYAYASLARFAPYHTWIYLYLVSLTGIAWALFLLESGGSPMDAIFVITTVVGVNLIVHALRFDRVRMSTRVRGSSVGLEPFNF
jgi:uncharacterized membrane protein HdeD (DUF308 family)